MILIAVNKTATLYAADYRLRVKNILVTLSCEEVGHNGINEVDFVGNNFWINEVEGGSNQTYLLLKVRKRILALYVYCLSLICRTQTLQETSLMN